MDGSAPTPTPRPRLTLVDASNVKKPVPMPRKQKTNEIRKEDNGGPESAQAPAGKSPAKVEEGVHDRARHVTDTTRNVSFRLRSIARRLTVRPSSPGKESSSSSSSSSSSNPKVVRSQSLPSEDIFQSISFVSPLINESSETLIIHDLSGSLNNNNNNNGDDDDDDDDDDENNSFGAPPPVYPPPPLPDESVYDEVQSVSTQCSGSCKDSLHSLSPAASEAIYEDVTVEASASAHGGRPRLGARAHDAGGFLLRSESWTYYGDARRDAASISPSLLSELDALGSASGEDAPDEDVASRPYSVQNDLYDAWEPRPAPMQGRRREDRTLPSKSVILEFDPLYENVAADPAEDGTLSLPDKKRAAARSPYGKINKLVRQSAVEDAPPEHDAVEAGPCPPVPPRRIDSIPQLAPEEGVGVPTAPGGEAPAAASDRGRSESPPEDSSSSHLRNLVRWASMKKAMRLVAETSAWSPGAMRRTVRLHTRQHQQEKRLGNTIFHEVDALPAVLERPSLEEAAAAAPSHSGVLYRVSRERQQEIVARWCILAEGKLTFYADDTVTVIKEVIALSSVLSVHTVLDHRISTDGDCFEINTSCKSRNMICGTSGTSERRVWMQKILESMTLAFPLRIVSDYTLAGWCFLKEGISGTWSSAWVLVHRRLLYYSLGPSAGTIEEVDLRKGRCIVLQDMENDTPQVRTAEKGPVVMVDCQGQALYLRMDNPRETTFWQREIRAAAVDNGPNLAQQQLMKDDVPCIVEKCVNFVYAHGSMSDGIYRRSGANSSVTRLLELFRLDAFAVQLSRQEYTEYDVSSVLKRFFRDLPEPLLTTELHGQFCDIAQGKCGRDHVPVYRRVLEQLPPVNFLTTRKLVGHLHFIHQQREKNRMPMENLAAIWGPTLMHIEASESLQWSKLETAVVADLIGLYPQLFAVDAEEQLRERRIQEVLERYHTGIGSAPPLAKRSGELHVWVHLHTRDSGTCVNVTMGPHKSAGEVCAELWERVGVPAHELCLEEVVCGGALVRVLHHTERVLDTVLRWGYWDDADRKDSALVLKANATYKEVAPLAKPPLAMCAELRFADRKSRSFKSFLFEFSQAKLCYYKDKRGSVKVREWNVEDIVWYMGYEPKRNPQMRWAITFIQKNRKCKRTKEKPFFGSTIAGASKEEQLRWMAALLVGEYPQGLMMAPVLLH